METEEEVRLFATQWDQAMVSNDVEQIAPFMSEDWVIVGSEGGITSKSIFLESIKSGEVTHSRMEADQIRIKVYGNTGVLTSRGRSVGKYKGADFDLYEWATSVFIRKENTWSCVLTMLTPAPKS